MSKHERRAPAKVNSNSKSKEKIQLSKWREQACFWPQNSSNHRKWREQTCFSMFSRWRQISNSNRMRNICRNGAQSEADLAQCGALALPPPFLFLWLLVQIFFNAPLSHRVLMRVVKGLRRQPGVVLSSFGVVTIVHGLVHQRLYFAIAFSGQLSFTRRSHGPPPA